MQQRSYGWIWKDGRGALGPKEQRRILAEAGVEPGVMFPMGEPVGREGDVVVMTTLAGLGDDPAKKRPRNALYLAERFGALDAQGVGLALADEGDGITKEYRGVQGLVELIRDWLLTVRQHQTAAAASAVRGKRRRSKFPKFYAALSDAERKRFLRDFGGDDVAVSDLEARYGVERTTLYRAEDAAHRHGEFGRLGVRRP